MVDLKEYEDMKYIKSQLDHDLWKTSMFDIIRYQKELPFENAVLPSVIEGSNTANSCRIKTIERISPISYQGFGNDKYMVKMPEYLRVYFVFDWSNDLKKECLDGECTLSKMDSLAAISINLPGRNNMHVDWFMEMSNPAYKHIKNIRDYRPRSSSASTLEKRIEVNFHLDFISYEDMTDSFIGDATYYKRLPSKITDFLSEDNLIGHYERQKVIEMAIVDGRSIPSTSYESVRVPGLLEKIKTPSGEV